MCGDASDVAKIALGAVNLLPFRDDGKTLVDPVDCSGYY
jgi:hypothetical protein